MNGYIKKAVFPVAGFGTRFLPATKAMPKELLPIVDMLNICVIKTINNLLNTYDNYTGKYKILLNFFNKVTSQVKD
jgi:UTP--glucose-1-phosphate uridylyltransferase